MLIIPTILRLNKSCKRHHQSSNARQEAMKHPVPTSSSPSDSWFILPLYYYSFWTLYIYNHSETKEKKMLGVGCNESWGTKGRMRTRVAFLTQSVIFLLTWVRWEMLARSVLVSLSLFLSMHVPSSSMFPSLHFSPSSGKDRLVFELLFALFLLLSH